MCGIAGIFDLHKQRHIDASLIQRMNDKQYHRGPDAGDYFFEAGIALAHRRLSIIDLEGSPQPMHSACGRAVIVFNGEIYNFKELRQELIGYGFHFNTDGDTETILNAYLHWGELCVNHLRGMFAFAIWDKQTAQLFLARDRLGIKPLYYSLTDSSEFIFASELKVLVEHPEFDKRLRITAIEDYFTFGYIPEPHSIYKNTYKLPPGHTLTIKKSQSQLLQPKQYWDIPTEPCGLDEQEFNDQLITRLKEAVQIRMVADVPLGAFLSGGVDSSSVVAMMSQLQSEPVNTCSIGFDSAKFNETEFAEQVADRYHTNHRVKQVRQDDFELIDELASLYDEPYADSSALPTYRVCQLAREHVTVALSGDGADELFAGYRRYVMHGREEKLRAAIPWSIRKPVFGPLGELYPKLDWAPRFLRAKTTFQSLALDGVAGYLNSISILREDERRKLYSASFKKTLNGYSSLQVFDQYRDKTINLDPIKTAQYLDLKTYLVGDILTKVDRASMAHSLEVRVPFLDHKLVEWGFQASTNDNIQQGIGKFTLKKQMQPLLPNDVLYRNKMGFAVPLAEWFRGPLQDKLRQTLLSDVMRDSDIFSMPTLEKLIDDHVGGVKDNSAPLWTLMMFAGFMQHAGVTGVGR
ncbi:XrtA/PEP-CTERM system amidotransferase [Thalassotalea maritima]|uniref:XrtA/PEP-CTERM system amidotransferase n=1 Tax=Thalassotalea maritima TaxID=3242416 RepID=UPI003526D517